MSSSSNDNADLFVQRRLRLRIRRFNAFLYASGVSISENSENSTICTCCGVDRPAV